MVVRLIPPSVGESYEGLSTDTKPTGVVINSTFREVDTGLRYLTPDGSTWYVQELSPSPVVVKIAYSFGKGSLTTDGIQYSAEVNGITHAAFVAIEAVTLYRPPGMILEEIEFGLTMAIKSSGATKHVKWKFQASDDGKSWQDLIAAQTRVANASAYADVTASGRFAPTGNFLGTGSSFQVRGVIQAEDAIETVAGKMKNSSYIVARYRRS